MNLKRQLQEISELDMHLRAAAHAFINHDENSGSMAYDYHKAYVRKSFRVKTQCESNFQRQMTWLRELMHNTGGVNNPQKMKT